MGEAAVQEERELIRRCLSAESDAIREFQERFGELIYAFPLRVYRVPRDQAGDFYVFAFDKGRIFRRIQTFEGRISLRSYLLGFVLDNLVLEWKRTEREIETVPIDAIDEPADERTTFASNHNGEDQQRMAFLDLLADIPPTKAVILKLLHVEDCELTPSDLRHIRKASGRRIPEILVEVERMRATVREREAGLKKLEDQLEGVQAWIHLYERRLRRIASDLGSLPPQTSTARQLREEQTELERKLKWRQGQRANIMERVQRRKVTTPYKDIATLLNTTIGNVASQILRVRKEVAARLAGHAAGDTPPSGESDV